MATDFLSRRMDLIHSYTDSYQINKLTMDTSYPVKLSGLVYKVFEATNDFILRDFHLLNASGDTILTISTSGIYDFGGNRLDNPTVLVKYYSSNLSNIYKAEDKVHCIIDFENAKIYLCSDTMYNRFISHTTDEDTGEGLFRIYDYDTEEEKQTAIENALAWNSIDDSHDSFIRDNTTYDLYQVIDKDNIIKIGGEDETFKLFEAEDISNVDADDMQEAIAFENDGNKSFIRDAETQQIYQIDERANKTSDGNAVATIVPVAETSVDSIGGFQYQFTELIYPLTNYMSNSNGYDYTTDVEIISMIYANINQNFIDNYCFTYDEINMNEGYDVVLSDHSPFNKNYNKVTDYPQHYVYSYYDRIANADKKNYVYIVIDNSSLNDHDTLEDNILYVAIDNTTEDKEFKIYKPDTVKIPYLLNFSNTPENMNGWYYAGAWFDDDSYFKENKGYIYYHNSSDENSGVVYHNNILFKNTNGTSILTNGSPREVYNICSIGSTSPAADEINIYKILKFYSNAGWTDGISSTVLSDEYLNYNILKAYKMDVINRGIDNKLSMHITPFACYQDNHEEYLLGSINPILYSIDPTTTPGLAKDGVHTIYDFEYNRSLVYFDMMSASKSKFRIQHPDNTSNHDRVTYVSGLTLASRLCISAYNGVTNNNKYMLHDIYINGEKKNDVYNYIFSAHNKLIPNVYNKENHYSTDVAVNSQLTRYRVFDIKNGGKAYLSEENDLLYININSSSATNTLKYVLYIYDAISGTTSVIPATVEKSIALMKQFYNNGSGIYMLECYYFDTATSANKPVMHRLNLYYPTDLLESELPTDDGFRTAFINNSDNYNIYAIDTCVNEKFIHAQVCYEASDTATNKILNISSTGNILSKAGNNDTFIWTKEINTNTNAYTYKATSLLDYLNVIQNVINVYKLYPYYCDGINTPLVSYPKAAYYKAADDSASTITVDSEQGTFKKISTHMIYYSTILDTGLDNNATQSQFVQPFGHRSDTITLDEMLGSNMTYQNQYMPTLKLDGVTDYTYTNYKNYLKKTALKDLFGTTISSGLTPTSIDRVFKSGDNIYLLDFMFGSSDPLTTNENLSVYDLYINKIIKANNATKNVKFGIYNRDTIKDINVMDKQVVSSDTTDYYYAHTNDDGTTITRKTLTQSKKLSKNNTAVKSLLRRTFLDVANGNDETDISEYLGNGIKLGSVTTGEKSLSTLTLNDEYDVPYSILGTDIEKIKGDYLNWNMLLNALMNDQSIDLLGDKLREIKNSNTTTLELSFPYSTSTGVVQSDAYGTNEYYMPVESNTVSTLAATDDKFISDSVPKISYEIYILTSDLSPLPVGVNADYFKYIDFDVWATKTKSTSDGTVYNIINSKFSNNSTDNKLYYRFKIKVEY